MLESTKRNSTMKNVLSVRTRIAPSPTGENLHIGNAYAALLNYVYAKKNKGQFIIRVEDTDRTRFIEGSQERILESLKWLGLSYDEGPDIGGPFEPYLQSKRLDSYKKYSEKLIRSGNAYYSFTTTQELEQMRKDQMAKGQPVMYDGRDKNLSKEQVNKFLSERKSYVIRLNMPDGGVTQFTDTIRGSISFENKLIDDAVLIKSDGFPTYHFAVVVDDYLMNISHIIRGEEWISSTPKHIALYKAFGWDLPVYTHIPLLRNPDKSKLSKRKNPVWVSWYKEMGFLPSALLNYLALMGWSMPDGRDKFTLDEMIKNFNLEDIKTSAPIFDIEKLKWLNKQYVQELDTKSYVNFISQTSDFSDLPDFSDIVKKTELLVKSRISTSKEFDGLSSFYFRPPKEYEIAIKDYSGIIHNTNSALEAVPLNDWKAETIGQVMQKVASSTSLGNSKYFMVIRVALTGRKVSPPLNESIQILGKEKTLSYLKRSVS